MLGVPVGWAYSHVGEWMIHKYVLHGIGKKRDRPFAFHFHDHHSTARKQAFRDPVYEGSIFKWNGAGKEAVALTAVLVAHLPLLPVAPLFTATVVASGVQYYRVHKRSHKDPEWAREHLAWHYDHHMGPNQHSNWGVRSDWVDRLLGTREPYAGTEREQRDIERRSARKRKLRPAA